MYMWSVSINIDQVKLIIVPFFNINVCWCNPLIRVVNMIILTSVNVAYLKTLSIKKNKKIKMNKKNIPGVKNLTGV